MAILQLIENPVIKLISSNRPLLQAQPVLKLLGMHDYSLKCTPLGPITSNNPLLINQIAQITVVTNI